MSKTVKHNKPRRRDEARVEVHRLKREIAKVKAEPAESAPARREAEASKPAPAWWADVDAEARARIASGDLVLAEPPAPREPAEVTDDVVTHDEARSIVDALDTGKFVPNDSYDDLRIYIRQQAERERKATDLRATYVQWLETEVDNKHLFSAVGDFVRALSHPAADGGEP